MLRLFAFLALLYSLAACAKKAQRSELVVGMDLSYPPFETIDANGRPAGVSVEIATALGTYLGMPVRIENIPFVGLIPSLKTGKVDVVISSMTDTPERRRSIAFSDPYLTIGLAMLAGKNSGIAAVSDADKSEKTIAVRQGTTGEAWAAANIKNAKILRLDKESAAVLEVIQGKADAFIYDQMSIWTNWHRHQDKTVAILKPITTEHWAIGMRLDDTKLKEKVNAFLEAFRTSGGFRRLGEHYLKEQKEAFKEQGVPFYF